MDARKRVWRYVLCPVALDDAWKTSDWNPVLRAQIQNYNILDFANWKDEEFFIRQYEKLRKGLSLFYQEEVNSIAMLEKLHNFLCGYSPCSLL